ncbi:MAG TPA: glycoside hydrolase family 52 protein [Opitutus sp.]|nr:glycoside hydrolase family 52 protein [Opitutus sp.]
MASSRLSHSPLGANASFDFGPPGELAGFAVPTGHPPSQDVYVGCRADPDASWNLLPCFNPSPGGPPPLPKGRYGRFLAWAGDKWMIGPLVFKLCTPFFLKPDDDDRFRYAPVVCGYLEYDNTHSPASAELVFGVSGAGEPINGPSLAGFGFAGSHGFATTASSEVSLRRDHELFGAKIGRASAFHFVVPPHSKRIHPLVFGFFQPGFHYTHHFADLDDVLAYGVSAHSRYLAASDARDAEFMRSSAAPDCKTRVATETRAWLAASRRLAGDPEVDLTPLRSLHASLTAPHQP